MVFLVLAGCASKEPLVKIYPVPREISYAKSEATVLSGKVAEAQNKTLPPQGYTLAVLDDGCKDRVLR